jgi:hypothetical protein
LVRAMPITRDMKRDTVIMEITLGILRSPVRQSKVIYEKAAHRNESHGFANFVLVSFVWCAGRTPLTVGLRDGTSDTVAETARSEAVFVEDMVRRRGRARERGRAALRQRPLHDIIGSTGSIAG